MGQHQSLHEMQLEEEGMHEQIEHRKDFNFVFWIGIILLLLFLGFNIFNYLGEFSDYIRKLFAPLLSFFGIAAGETTKQTLKTTATGTKGIIDTITNTATSGINLLENRLTTKDSNNKLAQPAAPSKPAPSLSKSAPSPPSSKSAQPAAPSKPAAPVVSDKLNLEKPDAHPNAIIAPISTNKSEKTSTGEPGYCFIGEEGDFRTCIKVESQHKCMSGDIFPTMDKCINPNLR